MSETAPVSDKTFETLNERQQALIDELARDKVDGLDRNIDEIVQAAAEDTPFDPYDPSYVSHLRRTHADIIDERADAILNDHATVERGNVRVTGDIDISDPEAYPKPQAFDERPVKETEPRLRVDLDLETALGVLAASDVPEAHREAVFEAVVDL